MSKKKLSKLLALYLPYVVIGLVATNLGEAWRLAVGKELGDKIVSLMDTLPAVFSNPLPSLHPFDLFIGLCCGAGMRLAVYLKGKNAKKYRHGMEYGSARWGGPKDIEPFMAPKFEDNIILTKTERLMMSNRPPDPKNARNKNVLVVGGSGSGKTRFFIKPNLLQCDSKNFPVSFVVTDPKGSIGVECGEALLKHGYKLKFFNTINFSKSMRYNPMAYIHSEKDVLKLVTALMTNTKGEGQGGDPFWDKAERLLLVSLIAYLHYEAPVEEQNFATLLEMLNTISEKNLPPDGQNTIPAARNWYLFELSDDDRKAIQQESVKILENIPQAGIGRRRIWEPETLPKDIRLINSHYDDLYRIPDGGVVQVDYPDGRSFTARLEHLDDYHFDMGGLGNVFHICQFAEVMERNHADFYPEIQTQDEQAAWELGGKGYLAIQSCEDGWDYTLYHSDYSVMDGGQLDAPELTIQEAREQILEAHHMEKGRRLLQDYDAVMDKVAEAEELSADHRPSTLEKLAELASDTSAPKSSARSAPEL